MAMNHYNRGLRRTVGSARARLAFGAKRLRGLLKRYPIYRPDFSHTVYAADNVELESTFLFDAKVVHQVSRAGPIPKAALIEFEHGSALVGHIGVDTDYRVFREQLPSRLKAFWDWFVPGRHRLVAPTHTAAQTAVQLFSSHGYEIPKDALDVLYWTHKELRNRITEVTLPLRVFHLGGAYPYSKGTRDVIDLARRFPSVLFDIWVDASHRCVKGIRLSNVNIWHWGDYSLYTKLLSQSHIVLLPTYGDAWGIVLEALAWAIPIITYDTFDKSETVIDGQTGYLCHLPTHLSLYDGFDQSNFHNWTDFNNYVADQNNAVQLDALSIALERYCKTPKQVLEHSRQSNSFFDERFKPGKRVPRIRRIYQDILSHSV